jgi:hypothetical protein
VKEPVEELLRKPDHGIMRVRRSVDNVLDAEQVQEVTS